MELDQGKIVNSVWQTILAKILCHKQNCARWFKLTGIGIEI